MASSEALQDSHSADQAGALPPMSRKRWAERVMEKQSHRNPEEIIAAQARIEAARQVEVCARKCKAVKGHSNRTRALAVEGLQQMAQSNAPEEYRAIQDRWQCAQQASRARQETKCSNLGKVKQTRKAKNKRSASGGRSSSGEDRQGQGRGRARQRSLDAVASGSGYAAEPYHEAVGSVRSRSCSPDGVLRQASDSEEDAMEEVAGLVGASDATAMASVAAEGLHSMPEPSLQAIAPPPRVARRRGSDSSSEDADSDSDFGGPPRAHHVQDDAPPPPGPASGTRNVVANVLQQLSKEPSDLAECAAKFSLYEGYASEVENMRNTLLKFHEDSRPALEGAILKEMDRRIGGIDRAEALGIPDEAREWFVYHMMRQAERNNMTMAGILDEFDKKLKFLAENDQVECPVCLDPFDDGPKAAETLGCCHKVCKECWHNWGKVMHGRPFCPFCRHEEFIGAVAARAGDSESEDDEF